MARVAVEEASRAERVVEQRVVRSPRAPPPPPSEPRPTAVVVVAEGDSGWSRWAEKAVESRFPDARVVLTPSPAFDDLARARVVLVLLSPALLDSTRAHEALEMAFSAPHAPPVIGVLLRPVEWRKLPRADDLPVFPLDGTPVAALPRAEQRRVLKEALRLAEVHGRFGPQEAPVLLSRPGAAADPLLDYASDRPDGDDLLGIKQDVDSLAALIAAWGVEPPLSIGLFGDWGSGKSFLMGKVKRRVADLAAAARESSAPQADLPYYRNIVQIEFNAWHYVEGDLYASLVEKIFSDLRLHERESPEAAKAREEQLKLDLKMKREEQEAAARERERLLDANRSAAEAVRTARERAEAAEALSGLATALERPEKERRSLRLTDEERALLAKLGVSLPDSASLDEVRAAVAEARGLARRVGGLLAGSPSDGRLLRAAFRGAVLVGAAGIAGAAAPLALGPLASVDLSPLVSLASGAVTTGLALAPRVRARLADLEEGITMIEERRRRLEAEVAEEESARRRIREDLARETEEAERRLAEADERLAATAKEIAAIEERLHPDPNREIAALISKRAEAEDYRKHLGVAAVVRRDFERLSELIKKQRDAEKERKEASGDAPYSSRTVNRIVLYIDDLDRCPPKKVVQVLQAVHLLLAFPLFVVVVAVDARWVSRSLSAEYELLLDDSHAAEGATPRDYLEKIFQVPFWVRPMSPRGSRRLAAGIAASSLREGPADATGGETGANGGGDADGRAEAGRGGGGEAPPADDDGEDEVEDATTVEERKETPEELLSTRNVGLTRREIALVGHLAPYAGTSPRAVKRFLNCYQILKAGIPADEIPRYLGERGRPAFRAHMALLAVVTGAPEISDRVLETLRALPKGATAGAWLDALDADPRVNTLKAWERAKAALSAGAGKEPGRTGVGDFVEAAPRVARFSFGTSGVEGTRSLAVLPGGAAPATTRRRA